MCCKGFFKRAVPFLAALVVGLFITSLFVAVAAPSFNFKKRGYWSKHREYDRKIERENRRLKVRNQRLERKIADLERQRNIGEVYELNDLDLDIPPVPPLAPIPPARER